jgi:DNA-binding winged helix-turn-helix (wHTH) protein/tetratricopeptide (TPR) repeat protein
MALIEYRFGRFRLLPSSRELLGDGQAVGAPRRVFDCLAYLLEHRDRAVGRDELVAAVWGRVDVTDVQLGQIVVRARRAVDDDGSTQHSIRTIAGFGYRWVAATEVVGLAASRSESIAPPPIPSTSESADVLEVAKLEESQYSSGNGSSSRSETLTTQRSISPPSRAHWMVAAVAALLIVVGWSAWLSGQRPQALSLLVPASPSHDLATALVLPIETSGKPDEVWVRLGAMDLVAERLRMAGLSVPSSESVLAVLQSAGDSKAERIAALRRSFDVGLIVSGSARRDGTRWRFELRGEDADGVILPVTYEHSDALHTARAAADTLLAAIGREAPEDDANRADLEEIRQRARAAMLANELETARAILKGSSELAGAPLELDFLLAQVDYREGKLDAVDAALTAMLAQMKPDEDPLFRARVLTLRGSTRVRRGEFARGGIDFDAALSALPAGSHSIERGKALAGRGSTRIPARRFDEALSDLGEARIDLAAAGDAFGTARVDANLGMLELYRGRPAAALDYLPRAAERLESFGALQEWQIALTALVETQLALLQRDEARVTAEKGWALRERMTDPDQVIDILLNRVQVLLGVGRYREADDLLAEPRTGNVVNKVLRARVLYLRTDLDWRRGRWLAASASANTALREWPDEGADAERDWIGLIEQRALLALGKISEVEKIFDRGEASTIAAEARTGSVYRALAEAEWLQAGNDPAGADRWFRRALGTAEQHGIPAEIAAVVAMQVPALLKQGRTDEARALAGRVAPWATRDFDSALVQLRLFHALGESSRPWIEALAQVRRLAGEREVPMELTTLSPRPGSAGPTAIR